MIYECLICHCTDPDDSPSADAEGPNCWADDNLCSGCAERIEADLIDACKEALDFLERRFPRLIMDVKDALRVAIRNAELAGRAH